MPARSRAHTRLRVHAGCPALHRLELRSSQLELFTYESIGCCCLLRDKLDAHYHTPRPSYLRIRDCAAVRPVLNPTAGVLSLLSFVSYDARRFRFPGSAFVERNTELEICLGGPGVFVPFVLNTNRFILPRLAQPQRTGSSFPVRSFEDATLDPPHAPGRPARGSRNDTSTPRQSCSEIIANRYRRSPS